MALLEAQGRGNPMLGEGVPEGAACVLGRALPGQPLNCVVGDEIDLGVE